MYFISILTFQSCDYQSCPVNHKTKQPVLNLSNYRSKYFTQLPVSQKIIYPVLPSCKWETRTITILYISSHLNRNVVYLCSGFPKAFLRVSIGFR